MCNERYALLEGRVTELSEKLEAALGRIERLEALMESRDKAIARHAAKLWNLGDRTSGLVRYR